MSKAKIFLSYSHQDKEAFDQLVRFLKPLARAGLLDYWADTRLTGGELWRSEIEAALASATVAVLLVSQDFLASEFIVSQEVPPLLERALARGLTLIPVFISPSSVREIAFALLAPGGKIHLADFQGYGSPDKTLIEMKRPERERRYTELAAQLTRLAQTAPPVTVSPPPAPFDSSPEPLARIAFLPPHSAAATKDHGETVPLPYPQSSLREALTKHWRENPLQIITALGGLVVGIPAAVGALGFLALRAREALLGLPALTYPKLELIAIGADALGSLPWRAFLALTAEVPTVRYGSWAVSGLSFVLLVAGVVRWRQTALRLAFVGITAVSLVAGGALYAVTIRAKPPCSDLSTPAERAAFEACSWLINDGERNDQRRLDLGGLLAWLLAAASIAAWTAAWTPTSGHSLVAQLRRGLVIVHLLIVAFFLQLLPRAYAFGEWGLRYPVVKLRQDLPECPGEIARALAAGACCAVDVSAGAVEKVLFVQGPACPTGPVVPLRTTSTDGSECVVRQSTSRVIAHGC